MNRVLGVKRISGQVAGIFAISICLLAGQSAAQTQPPQTTAPQQPAQKPQGQAQTQPPAEKKPPAKQSAPLQTFTGIISDGQCAPKGSHKEIMRKASVNTAANCVKGCARRYGYVLYDPASKKVYKLNDEIRPAELAGKRVKIKGALQRTTQTIYVGSIEPAR